MAHWSELDTAGVLAAWDNGESVWSCEMGGIGPGYEQTIQNIGFEMLRAIHESPPENWDMDKAKQREYSELIEKKENVQDILIAAQPSGSQFGAALNMAAMFARHGYSKGMEMVPDDRRILVSKRTR